MCGGGRVCRSRWGVARTKFLAKVASGVAKPDGLLVVPPGGELRFLHPLPVERLWGVGPVKQLFVQLELPLDPRAHREVVLDTVRDRFGPAAVSRAASSTTTRGIQMPTLPD